MKNYSFLLILWVSFSGRIFAADFAADSVFNSANVFYANNNFEKAIDNYKLLLGKGYKSAELYFNLGNAYYKLANYPRAILNYERALLYDPRNENIKFNLEKSQIYIVDKVDEIPEFLIKGWIREAIEWFKSDTWALMSIIFFLTSIIGFLLFFLTRKISVRRTGFYTAILLIILSALTFIMAYKARAILINGNGAIVMTPTVTVKGSPSNTSTDLFIIHEGTKVFILEELNDWFEVKLSDGKQGWLLKSDVEPI